MSAEQQKVMDRIKQEGYIAIRSRDPLSWKARQAAQELWAAGKLRYYKISPSYDGYAMPLNQEARTYKAVHAQHSRRYAIWQGSLFVFLAVLVAVIGPSLGN